MNGFLDPGSILIKVSTSSAVSQVTIRRIAAFRAELLSRTETFKILHQTVRKAGRCENDNSCILLCPHPPKCLISECFILALPPILVRLESLGCQRDAPEVTWLRLSGCLRVAFSAPSGLLRTASAGRHGTGRERRSVCACVQVQPQQSCDTACLVYLLQAAAVSQTDQGHAQLFTDSVQLCLGLLRQSAGGLIQDWEN